MFKRKSEDQPAYRGIPEMLPRNMRITHQMFADDLIIFGRVRAGDLVWLKSMLSNYSEAIGQSINYGKSKVYTKLDHMSMSEARILRDTLAMPVEEEGLTYLGVPIVSGKPKRALFQPIFQFMHDNLTKWREVHLAIPANLVLIKAVLLAKPSFWFRSIAFPRNVLREMEGLSFLWGGRNGIRWVSWDSVCSPSACGGMGLVKPKVLNNAYLRKHATTLATVEGNIESNQWKEIMSAKYGGRSRHPHSPWTGKAIWERQSDDDLRMSWQIGKGDKVSIWFDAWILPKPLASYPYQRCEVYE